MKPAIGNWTAVAVHGPRTTSSLAASSSARDADGGPEGRRRARYWRSASNSRAVTESWLLGRLK